MGQAGALGRDQNQFDRLEKWVGNKTSVKSWCPRQGPVLVFGLVPWAGTSDSVRGW